MFYNCTSLEGFQVDNENKKYCDVDGVLYTKDTNELICYLEGKKAPEGKKAEEPAWHR